jgi:hypothetical protein
MTALPPIDGGIVIPPEAFAAAISVTAARRKVAIDLAMMLVANGKLPAWSAFDYAYALDRFLSNGLPPRDIPKPAVARRRKRTVN